MVQVLGEGDAALVLRRLHLGGQRLVLQRVLLLQHDHRPPGRRRTPPAGWRCSRPRPARPCRSPAPSPLAAASSGSASGVNGMPRALQERPRRRRRDRRRATAGAALRRPPTPAPASGRQDRDGLDVAEHLLPLDRQRQHQLALRRGRRPAGIGSVSSNFCVRAGSDACSSLVSPAAFLPPTVSVQVKVDRVGVVRVVEDRQACASPAARRRTSSPTAAEDGARREVEPTGCRRRRSGRSRSPSRRSRPSGSPRCRMRSIRPQACSVRRPCPSNAASPPIVGEFGVVAGEEEVLAEVARPLLVPDPAPAPAAVGIGLVGQAGIAVNCRGCPGDVVVAVDRHRLVLVRAAAVGHIGRVGSTARTASAIFVTSASNLSIRPP